MSQIHSALSVFVGRRGLKVMILMMGLLLARGAASGQTFHFPSQVYVDSLSLEDIVTTPGPDTVTVTHPSSSGYSIKSIIALTKFRVDVKSPDVGQKQSFTYLITYKTIGTPNPSSPTSTVVSAIDTLSVSYDRDSLKLINDQAFTVAGNYHTLKVVILDVFEITNPGSTPVYTQLIPSMASSAAGFVHVFAEIQVQKYMTYTSLTMPSITAADSIATKGVVALSWSNTNTPAGYEVEWTYVDPYSAQSYDFRNNATRVFTNQGGFRIPVAQKEGTIVFRARMVRPSLTDLTSRSYGAWSLGDQGSLSGLSAKVAIAKTHNDSLNWDLKMSFVEDGKYKQVMTYYDGLFKPKQVQTRFNSRSGQTIVAQSLFDHEGRAVINSLPIPVNGVTKFNYLTHFLHPTGAAEYDKLDYDGLPDTSLCPPHEVAVGALDPAALSAEYYSPNNPDQTGKNAYIADAEGYPFTRKILAAENSEKILFEGQAGPALQLGHDRQVAYLYGSPLQPELNKYFGQDIGQMTFYRKMITTDNHQQDMFTITNDEGKVVLSGLIGTPDTNSLALSVKNSPVNDTFHANLLPIPNIRLSDIWKNNGSYFVERDANYSFEYKIEYPPFRPCSTNTYGLLPKIYYNYEVLDNCGNLKLVDSGALGGVGVTTASLITHDTSASAYLMKGNHVWNKESHIKLEDLTASVNDYLNLTNGCFLTFNDFVHEEFVNGNFPCTTKGGPCEAMMYAMMKDMYPGAKYGEYVYLDSVSKTFGGERENSIFEMDMDEKYRYQKPCVTFPDSVYFEGKWHKNIKSMTPQQLINIFNDSIAKALLPLHPDYCKLQLCEIINLPYTELLVSLNKASQAAAISRYHLSHIVTNDPLFTNNILDTTELKQTLADGAPIDSIAFMRTICGSEYGTIESVCSAVNAGKTAQDIVHYPVYMQDEYYKNLIKIYVKNRQDWLAVRLSEITDTCGVCDTFRFINVSVDTSELGDDSVYMVNAIDSMMIKMNIPVGSSFSGMFAPATAGSAIGVLTNMINAKNAMYCTVLVDQIISNLSGCAAATSSLNELRDTLLARFCANNHRIAALTYDTLNSIIEEVGLSITDLCNAGLADIRRLENQSGDFVKLGLLQYSPMYYSDMAAFIDDHQLLSFIGGSSNSMTDSLYLCWSHPFEQAVARQIGATLTPSNCFDKFGVTVKWYSETGSNTVKLSFINPTTNDSISYFLYPTDDTGKNALNADFGASPVTGATDYQLISLFNLYGFNRVSNSLANRNSILLTFNGTQDAVVKKFAYFISVFKEDSDYNTMEKDQKEYLNGVGCSEFIQMAKGVVAKAEALNINAGHPYFEQYFENVINNDYNINFDFGNYEDAIRSCGLTDSVLLKKNFAHFKIKFHSSVSTSTVESYINTLMNVKKIGVANTRGYETGGNQYLLLDVYQIDTNLNATQLIMQSALPGGSTMVYLPYLQRDTVAQLISSGFSPVDQGALATAFPGATITSAACSVHYYIPGAGTFSTTGDYITIENSISSDYDYNHYVDSICRFVQHTAPLTEVLTHAESAVSAQYDDWQMTAWRNYVRGLSATDHNSMVKNSKAGKFNTLGASSGSYSFSASGFSYNSALRPDYLNDLMIDHDPNGGTYYSYIKSLLQSLETYNNTNYTLNTMLKPTGLSSPINNLLFSHTETRTFVCGDTTQFWVNHFDTARGMINVFVKLPGYLPMPRTKYALIGISKGFEKDSATYMKLIFRGQNGALVDTMECVAYTNRNLGAIYTIPSAFLSSHSQFEQYAKKFENCETRTIEHLYPVARNKYNQYIDSVREALITAFRQHIIDSLVEYLTVSGNDIKHGVTVYYYDLAGNLIKTVSPGGTQKLPVGKPDNDSINAHRLRNELISPLVPAHSKVTLYKYNAQNKVVETESPDGGKIRTQYDKAGRAALSQDEKQWLAHDYTYFLYDNLSRVVETGIIHMPGGWPSSSFFNPSGSVVSGQVTSLLRREVTATIYDTASYKTVGKFQALPAQDNLKNRVSSTKYYEIVAPSANAGKDSMYNNALHYSYDISGNVKTLIHDLKTVVDSALRFKRVDYEYDLYSGKVMMVSYNRGKADQFYQKYAYDSDNRITDVHSSSNGIVWDRDAHYDYYDHGPLARTDLGEQRVQGVDYAYTINGWLKAINGVENEAAADMGEDGLTGTVMPQDVFSQRVDYFTGDYKAIADSNYFRELPGTPKSLYNGNIAGIATALTPFSNLLSKYHYDPLQRIDRADYTEYDYDYVGQALYSTNIPDYASKYKYDADGNLLKLHRQGGTVPSSMNGGTAITQHSMDSLTYRYTAGTNQLKNLQDSSSTLAFKIDIPPLTGDTSLSHYTYDVNGNMTKDLVSGLTSIDWNRFGKVRQIVKLDGTRINFSYDPMGNRLAKEVVSYPGTDTMLKLKTVYVRDAAGNSLAVYENKKEFDLTKITPTVLTGDPGIGFGGPLPPIFTSSIATQLLNAQTADPDANLATLAMAVPALADYVANASMLQDLVGSLTHAQALAFLKSIPAITEHTLAGPGEELEEEKLSVYLQPVMLSTGMGGMQTELLSELKDKNTDLFYSLMSEVPATTTQKDDFPSDLTLIEAYNGMDLELRMQINSDLAEALTGSSVSILPEMVAVLTGAYNSSNSYADFITDVPNSDYIFDELRADAASYLGYRYGLIDLEEATEAEVQNEFKYNTVLAEVLGDGAIDGGADALTMVLSDHFDEVLTLAQTAGKDGQLAAAMKLSLTAIDADMMPPAWLKYNEILQSDRAHLAEHHIYGSSRLGMQKYLPQEYQYEWVLNQAAGYQSLIKPKPWYSLYGNDLFNYNIYANSLSTANMSTTGIGISTHVLGKRHYELTNHLGNVQATILDRTSPLIDTNDNDAVTGYHANISTAQDYYPFGMYMPGRYLSDTGRHCVTMNHIVLVPKPLTPKAAISTTSGVAYMVGGTPAPPPVGQLPKAANFTEEDLHVFHYNTPEEHENGWVLQTNLGEDSDSTVSYVIDLGGEPGDIMGYLQLHMDTSQEEQFFGFGLELPEGVDVSARVRQFYDDSNEEYYDVLEWASLNPGDVELIVPVDKTAVLAGGNTTLELLIKYLPGGSFASGLTVTMNTPHTVNWVMTPENRVVTICEDDDEYRFGFNGQEKVNEVAGIGNHNTALFWEYDTRLGRRWNIDPVKDHTQSSYATFNGNPISNTDRLGNVGEPVVKDGQLTIYSNVLCYGGAATDARAKQLASNMQRAWTSANGTVTYKGVEYRNVQFVVTARVVTEEYAKARAAENKGENYDPRLNFARIESRENLPANTPNRVSGHKAGGDNSFFLVAEDITPENTTQAHEYGHGLGLGKHVASFDRFQGPPRIMTTIHTAVDGAYTVDGLDGVPQGQNVLPLHLLNQNCRRVTQEDIGDMNIENYTTGRQPKGLGKDGYRVGSSSNDLFNSNGKPVSESTPPQSTTR